MHVRTCNALCECNNCTLKKIEIRNLKTVLQYWAKAGSSYLYVSYCPGQLHEVLAESDRSLAVVRDLFGDDPKVRPQWS